MVVHRDLMTSLLSTWWSIDKITKLLSSMVVHRDQLTKVLSSMVVQID
jgi:hypothetical protein